VQICTPVNPLPANVLYVIWYLLAPVVAPHTDKNSLHAFDRGEHLLQNGGSLKFTQVKRKPDQKYMIFEG